MCHNLIGADVIFEGFCQKFRRKLSAETFFIFAYQKELWQHFYTTLTLLQISVTTYWFCIFFFFIILNASKSRPSIPIYLVQIIALERDKRSLMS